MFRILVVDDDKGILAALKLLLSHNQYDVVMATSPSEALSFIQSTEFDAAIIDMNYHTDTTSGTEGLDLIQKIKTIDNELRLIAMTGWASTELVMDVIKAGAHDFIEKPWGNDRLLSVVRSQVDLTEAARATSRLTSENQTLLQQLDQAPKGNIASRSPAMQQLLKTVNQIANTGISVYISGENGTGKSTLARYLHSLSNRADEHFVAVNMGAIPENLFESEMFGHIKGAFTDAKATRIGRFELANNGTLFLDEISNIPMVQQAKLLHVLETSEFERVGSSITKTVNIRVVSASNANINQQILDGHFRQDLWYRLNAIEITIPPLRERTEDIPELCSQILGQLVNQYTQPLKTLTREAQQKLLAYCWPGNIRELHHVLERGMLLSTGESIDSQDLLLPEHNRPMATPPIIENENSTLDELEKDIMLRRIKHCGGNMTQTAKSLGLSRSAFYRRLEKHKLI